MFHHVSKSIHICKQTHNSWNIKLNSLCFSTIGCMTKVKMKFFIGDIIANGRLHLHTLKNPKIVKICETIFSMKI
jgi:hypothetical protein